MSPRLVGYTTDSDAYLDVARTLDHGRDALLVDPRDPQAMAAAVQQILGERLTGDASGPNDGYSLHLPDGSLFPGERLPLVRALRGESTEDVEILIRRRDGTSRWPRCRGSRAA